MANLGLEPHLADLALSVIFDGVNADERADDLALLRAYEPVLRCSAGEQFFPTGVEGYVRECSLWRDRSDRSPEQIVPPERLDIDRLCAAARSQPGANLHLKFVQKAASRSEVHRLRHESRPSIRRIGRLAAVGLLARIVDVLVRASLLVRGAVPGGVAAAAANLYRERLDTGSCVYYGRVVRDAGYVVLQYWFFYAMNDWRTTFGGVNDHEADWELTTVFLAESGNGKLSPAWVAVSTHDYSGDELRRRWDDPDLRREGDHPVVFVGAGSHSGAVIPGDYLVHVSPAPLGRVVAVFQRITGLLFPWVRDRPHGGIGIPFIDYARGDGVKIGLGGERTWDPVLIDEDTPWVRGFRGLWGRETRDRFGGERAPAGPRYERDGRVRTSWTDPVGWVGLQKVPPDPAATVADLAARAAVIDDRIAALDSEIEDQRDELRQLRSEAIALDRQKNTRNLARKRFAEVATSGRLLAETYATRADLIEERDAHRRYLADPPPPEPPQTHLRAPRVPYEYSQQARTRFLTVWAAISTPAFLLALVALLLTWHWGVVPAFLGVLLLFSAIEAVARRKLIAFLTGLLVLCAAASIALAAAAVLLQSWRIAVPGLLAGLAMLLLFVNLRDLLRR